ncbi:MAG: Tfp pilus assembly protein FimT/FimU [Planctomycetaceae bacterium]
MLESPERHRFIASHRHRHPAGQSHSILYTQRSTRSGFTLVELLVAIAIFSILVTLSLSAFKESDQDRAAAGAQQLRSMFEGARSRAIHDQLPRGIRLILDPNNPRMAVAAVYIGAPETFVGQLSNRDLWGPDLFPGPNPVSTVPDDAEYGWFNSDPSNRRYSDDGILATADSEDGTVTAGFTPLWRICDRSGTWKQLRQRKLLAHTGEYVGARIKIPAQLNSWFPIVAVNSRISLVGDSPLSASLYPSQFADTEAVVITIAGQYPLSKTRPDPFVAGASQDYATITTTSKGVTTVDYEIELAPPILPGSVPQTFPNGIAIDLDGSKIPTSWQSGGSYINHLDILFSPRGEVIGSAASAGIMHFVVADADRIVAASLEASAVPVPMRKLRYVDSPPSSPDKRAPVLRIQDPSNPTPDAEIPTVINDRVVTLFARTGQVTTSQVNHFDSTKSAYEFGIAGKDKP